MIDLPPFDALALSLHHSPGVHAILVGSGLSRAAGIPTGWEITLDLIRRLAALEGLEEHDDWAEWYRSKYSKEPSYSEILDALASTPAERRDILHGYIDPPENGDIRKPTKAHHAIAQLVASGAVRVIVTTNFDRLIENALREQGIEPTVIASDDAIAGATPLVHTKCTVIKVHGDYLDSRIKNTDAELEDYSPALNTILDQVFDNFGLLTVGWSGDWDTALRSAILRAPSRRYPFYWAARGKMSSLAEDLLSQRGGRHFDITDADTFFVKLAETLAALKQASRPHPQSVEMTIALAKRYCRDDKFAMEWAELLHVEVEQIRKFVLSTEYKNTNWSAPIDAMNLITNKLMVISHLLRRLCLICGRWGTDRANKSALKAIQSLIISEINRNGIVALLDLRNFPSSICYYWLTAGANFEERFSIIYELTHAKNKRDGNNVILPEILNFFTYGDNDWKYLKGFERHHTPISDFLSTTFELEASDISLSESEADELFDKTEVTLSLAFAHNRLQRIKATGMHFYMPVGRFLWKSGGTVLENELKRIEELPDTDAYFKAGLMGGSKAAMAPTLEAVRSFRNEAARYFW